MNTKKVKVSSIEQDKALVNLIVNGSSAEKEEAFNTIFKKYKSGIFQKMNIGVRFNAELAKDLMMDVFMKIHINIASYKPKEAAFSTWLYTIANNVLIDYKRGEKYEILSIEDLNINGSGEDKEDVSFSFQIADNSRNNNGFDVMVSTERANTVHKAIESISSDLVREAVKMRFIDEMSYEEIAAFLNIPVGSAKAYVNRAKAEIKNYIEKKMSI